MKSYVYYTINPINCDIVSGDERAEVRQRAVEIEVRAREQAASRPASRSFQLILPKIQQSARHYLEMVKIHSDNTGYGYDYYYPSSKHNQKLQTISGFA